MIPSFGLMSRNGMQPVKSDFVAQEVGRMPKTAIFDVSWQGIPISSHQPKQRFRMLIQSAVRHVTPPLSSKRHLAAADNLSDQIKSLGAIWNRSSPGVRDAM